MASRNVGCFLRFAGEVLFSLLAIDDDLNAKAMKMSAQLRKVGNVAFGPRTFRQWVFFSLGTIKLLMKAERDGGIPVLVRLLELSVVLANDICFDKTKNWLTFFIKKIKTWVTLWVLGDVYIKEGDPSTRKILEGGSSYSAIYFLYSVYIKKVLLVPRTRIFQVLGSSYCSWEVGGS